MSLLASATYIFNDMLDLQADRQNSTKCTRALASGTVPIVRGIQLIVLLVFLLSLIALILPQAFNAVLLVYLIATLTYTLWLKKKTMLDVITIAGSHTLRVVVGIVVIQAEWSFWLCSRNLTQYVLPAGCRFQEKAIAWHWTLLIEELQHVV